MTLTVEALTRARRRLIEMHHAAKVGHLGGNLSALDAMMLVHHELMRPDDRFILSKGHSAGALYVTLSTLGRLSDNELGSFHADGTRLPGHPPAHAIADIPFATGSLGHGLSLAAGLALGAKLRDRDDHVFCLTSDGEWQEGSTWEALIFAAHHRLARLTVLVDHNRLQGFGTTRDVASMDPLWERLAGFPIEVRIADGHDLDAMRAALRPGGGRPVVVVLETHKGKGVEGFEDRMESHYLPITDAQYTAAVGPAPTV
jgi:transketolase